MQFLSTVLPVLGFASTVLAAPGYGAPAPAYGAPAPAYGKPAPTYCATKSVTLTKTATKTATKTTTATVTQTAKATPSCTSITANFDDVSLELLNLVSVTQLGLYKGIDYSSLSLVGLGDPPLLGLSAHSGSQGAGFGPVNLLTQGKPFLYANGVDYVDLQSFYFGCVLADSTSIVSVPTSCSITVAGFRNGAQVATQDFSFAPDSLLASEMHLATLSAAFTNLDYVSVINQGILSVLELVAFDDVSYKLCTYQN
ncbi:uncharacterized protein RCC_05266 [Ramularia collo-cygni]|uniref:Uncharacterized protein n=1 Tax=Ramularia collo-cygni TaxID=112498 RepID=A0A2D3UYH2_9PEZI|nr:uncharacterized protein RCC_05266 [Ramularia collo-cygni]CZT19415.1 uncharacterized protein RCC_05266 [Ramularia collo-cygni]